MNERWLPVVGWEGFYEVSDLGRVRSIARRTPAGLRGGKMLKLTPRRKTRRLIAHLSKDGVAKGLEVHRLVLHAFVGACPEGMEACHFPDRDPANCKLGNLRWDTSSANKLDAIRHGTFPRTRKYDHDQIVALRKRGDSVASIRAATGISSSHIYKLLNGKSWQIHPEVSR